MKTDLSFIVYLAILSELEPGISERVSIYAEQTFILNVPFGIDKHIL